jgi:abhydrolase domain-containing protein 6
MASWSAPETMLYDRLPSLILGWANQAIRLWSGLRRYEVQVGEDGWVYLAGGKGAPIVFVHGFDCDKDRFWTFLSAFSRSYRVVVPDLPGFGESAKSLSECYDIASQVRRLNAFLEKIGLHSFHLFGISMGGYICGYYASEYPDKVRSLALMDAAGVSSRKLSDALRLHEEAGKNVFLYKTAQEFDELMSLVFHRPPWIPGLFKRHFALRGAHNYTLRAKILDDIIDGGINLLDDRLSGISAETLVVWGANDRIMDVSSVETFMRGIPKCRSVVLDDCGHVPYVEKAKTAKRLYKAFLANLS